MKKKLNLFFLLILLTCSYFAEGGISHAYDLEADKNEYLFQSDDDVLRGFVWGLSPDIIRSFEKGTFVGETDEGDLFFLDKIFGIRSTIGYLFKNEKLSKVTVFNEKFYSQPQDRITDLLTLQAILTKRYGQPSQENFIWQDDKNKNFPDDWGWSIYTGDLAIRIIWQTDNENIYIDLITREKYEPKFSLTFERANNGAVEMPSGQDNDFFPRLPTPQIQTQ